MTMGDSSECSQLLAWLNGVALAEETSAGVTVVITEVASMHGIMSTGNCFTPYACPIVFFDATILHTANMTQPSQSALSGQ